MKLFAEYKIITLGKHISLPSARQLYSANIFLCRVSSFTECFFLVCEMSNFAECFLPRLPSVFFSSTRQTILHSAYLLFPVVEAGQAQVREHLVGGGHVAAARERPRRVAGGVGQLQGEVRLGAAPHGRCLGPDVRLRLLTRQAGVHRRRGRRPFLPNQYQSWPLFAKVSKDHELTIVAYLLGAIIVGR